jgi:hypothetical protein
MPEAGGARTTPQSLLARKLKAATPIKLDAFAQLDRYIDDFSRYVTMRKVLKDAADLVRSKEFTEKYGDFNRDLLMEHLNAVARNGRTISTKLSSFMTWLRKKTSAGAIILSPASAVVHSSNAPLAFTKIGPMWYWRAIEKIGQKESQDFLLKYFAETYARGGGEPAVSEVTLQRIQPGTKMEKAVSAGFAPQRWIDRTMSQSIVLGSYMKDLEGKGLDPERFAELPVDLNAVRKARVLARRAVASPLVKDVPLALTRGPLFKAFFQFHNFALDRFSNAAYEASFIGIPEAFKKRPQLAMATLGALISAVVLESSIKFKQKRAMQALAGQKPKDDDTYMKELEREALRNIPGMSVMQANIEYGEVGIPSLDVPRTAITSVAKAIKSDQKSTKVLEGTRAATAAASLFVPGASMMGRTAEAIEKRVMFKPHEERLKSETGKKVEDMTLDERVAAEKTYKKNAEKGTREERAKAAERSIEDTGKRGSDVQKELSKADQQWLTSRDLSVPGYDNKIRMRGTTVYLTEKELERYGKYIKEEYTKGIQILRNRYDTLTEDGRPRFFGDVLSNARERARLKIEHEMSGSGNERNQRKKTRFTVFQPER